MKSDLGLEFAAKTDTGLVRSQNEDAVAVSPAHRFAVLADGMGGYNAGEVASNIAVAVTRRVLEDGLGTRQSRPSGSRRRYSRQVHQLLVDSFQRANTAVLDAAHDVPAYNGMGTTLVAAIFHRGNMTLAHVGDSRAYRFRDGGIDQITRDHSLLQEQIDAGLVDPEWARFSQNKNLVTRAVGVGRELDVEVHEHQVKPGDLYLLCSDGLSDMLSAQEICDILTSPQSSLDAVCDALVGGANRNGGLDNISAILIKVEASGAKREGLFERLFNWSR